MLPGHVGAHAAEGLRKAKALLQQAGYSNEGGGSLKDGKELVVNLLGGQHQQNGPEMIAKDLRDIGVKVELRLVPISRYAADFVGGKFDLSIFSLPTVNTGPFGMRRLLDELGIEATRSEVEAVLASCLEVIGTENRRVTEADVRAAVERAQTLTFS